MYLLHWCHPPIDVKTRTITKIPIEKTWKDMEALVKSDLTRSIGVSNCSVAAMMNLIAGAEIPPANNQIELHPYAIKKPLVDFHKKFDIAVTAYAPIGAPGFLGKEKSVKKMSILRDPVITKISEAHRKTPA